MAHSAGVRGAVIAGQVAEDVSLDETVVSLARGVRARPFDVRDDVLHRRRRRHDSGWAYLGRSGRAMICSTV